MVDTSTNVAMRPPRIEEGYSRPTAPERERFFGTARSMAAPALAAARANLEASRGGVGDYLANMPLAALNLADAAVRGGVGAFADLIPGLSPAAERDLAREVLAVPEAFAGSAGRVPSALDEGLGGLSEVARRMFQEGPVPDRLMSGIDPEEFLRLMRGRRDAAELQRRREDMIAGGIPEAEVDRRLGIAPRTADQGQGLDPDAVLADFSAAREAMLGASRDMSFAELQALSGAQAAARDAAVAALSDAPTVRLFDRNDRAVVVGPGMGPGEEGRFRVTYFDADRQPSNHTVYETKEEALNAALREGFVSRTAAPAAPTPDDFGFRQDNPALSRGDTEWLANKQRVADETYDERRGITGSTTAQLGQSTDMFLPTDVLRRIPGLNRENRRPGDPKYDELLRDVRDRGFLPDQDRNRIVLGVNHRGEPFLVEGNTRVAVASDVGVPNVRVEVIYKNGGEMVDGPFAPENVARIAARGPRPENFAQGGAVMMRSDMPEQIHQGVGSLSEVARRMFQGGVVSGGHPLDQYGRYLTQTYAEPIQRLAADTVNQFVDSVRQKEQAFFGGGGAGSPLQGGLMGSPTDAGSTLAIGGLSAPMGQVGSLAQNPLQGGLMGSPFEAIAGGTFDAQVAAANNTPPMPSHMIGQKLAAPMQGGLMGSPMPPGGMQMAQHSALQASMPAPDQSGGMRGFGVMEGFAPPVNDGFAENRLMQQTQIPAGYTGGRNIAAAQPSPFGNSLKQQQMQMLKQQEMQMLADGLQGRRQAPPMSSDELLSALRGGVGSAQPSPFGNNLVNQQVLGQARLEERPSLNPLVERQGLV